MNLMSLHIFQSRIKIKFLKIESRNLTFIITKIDFTLFVFRFLNNEISPESSTIKNDTFFKSKTITGTVQKCFLARGKRRPELGVGSIVQSALIQNLMVVRNSVRHVSLHSQMDIK